MAPLVSNECRLNEIRLGNSKRTVGVDSIWSLSSNLSATLSWIALGHVLISLSIQREASGSSAWTRRLEFTDTSAMDGISQVDVVKGLGRYSCFDGRLSTEVVCHSFSVLREERSDSPSCH